MVAECPCWGLMGWTSVTLCSPTLWPGALARPGVKLGRGLSVPHPELGFRAGEAGPVQQSRHRPGVPVLGA